MNLPKDVVFEILVKLPVRTLVGFRCVCKGWYAVINSRLFQDTHLGLRRAMAVDEEFFVFEHLRREPNDNMFTCYVSCCNGDYRSFAAAGAGASSNNNNNYLKILGNFSYPTIINHVNGLVCVSDPGEERFMSFMSWFDITLLNPGLRQVRKLPVPDLDLFTGGFPWSIRGIGFGYDDANNEYKVVVIGTHFGYDDDNAFYVKSIALVYYLSTNSWKILGNISSNKPLLIFSKFNCIFSHGSIHFIIMLSPTSPDYGILTLSMTNELFHKIDFPHGWKDYCCGGGGIVPCLLTVDKSTIALGAFTSEEEEEQVLDIWVMKEYGDAESWTKQYSIGSSLPRLITRPLSLWRRDRLFLVTQDGDVICYHLSTGHQLRELELTNARNVLTCNETFVSIK